MKFNRSTWAAVGAATAVAAGAGGIGFVQAEEASSASSFVSNVPCRVLDTRTDADISTLGEGESITLDGRGSVGDCELPSDATGLSVNIAAVRASADTFLTAYPTGSELPASSHVNVSGGVTTSNGVDVSLSADGQLDVYNAFGDVDLIIDVMGAYVPASSGTGEAGPKGDTGPAGPEGPAGEPGIAHRAVQAEIEVELDYYEDDEAEYSYYGPLNVCDADEVMVDITDVGSEAIVEFPDFPVLRTGAEAAEAVEVDPLYFGYVSAMLASQDDPRGLRMYGPGAVMTAPVFGQEGVDAYLEMDGPEPEAGWPETQIVTAVIACGPVLEVEGVIDGTPDNDVDDSWEGDIIFGAEPAES